MTRHQSIRVFLLAIFSSSIMVALSENFYSFFSFLTFVSLLPILYLMHNFKLDFKVSYFIAFLHVMALFAFIWLAYPFEFLENDITLMQSSFYGAFLHLSLTLFISLPFSLWVFSGSILLKKYFNLNTIIILSFLYLFASALAVLIFDTLMYSKWSHFYPFSSSYFLFGLSLADNVITLQAARLFADWGLVLLAIFRNAFKTLS